MEQKIVCHLGKCHEENITIMSEIDKMFNKNNIVEQIQLDLFKKQLR